MSDKIKKQDYISILNYANSLNFSLVGITKPVLKKEDFDYLEFFIRNKYYANMHWFSKNQEIRLNPHLILKDSKSVLVLGFYYKDKNYESILASSRVKISRYAIGKDYHKILKKKLKKIEIFLKKLYPEIQTRSTVDSAPVPEKLLAKYSGIGWQGKNTNLIHPKFGSYFFISCIFTNFEISEDIEIKEEYDHCKHCNLCILSCPTKALKPYQLDVKKCISYLNIESKENVDPILAKNFKGWVFGCDICQEVCPFNKITKNLTTNEEDFFLRENVKEILQTLPTKEKWNSLTNSPLKRVQYEIFKNNYEVIKKHSI